MAPQSAKICILYDRFRAINKLATLWFKKEEKKYAITNLVQNLSFLYILSQFCFLLLTEKEELEELRSRKLLEFEKRLMIKENLNAFKRQNVDSPYVKKEEKPYSF